MDGLALLDLLKRNPETRHIPVHVISADEQNRLGLTIGAYGYTDKPIERERILATLDEVKKFGRAAPTGCSPSSPHRRKGPLA